MATPPDFTAGQVLTAAQMNAVGLWLVKARTTFSAVSSVAADNVFTADFTNYLITVEYTTSSTGGIALQLRVATVAATTGYNRQSAEFGGTTTTVARATAQTTFGAGSATNGNFRAFSNIWVSRPALAEPTVIAATGSSQFGAYNVPELRFLFGNHETATAYDGIQFLASSGQTITGAYTIFGVRG